MRDRLDLDAHLGGYEAAAPHRRRPSARPASAAGAHGTDETAGADEAGAVEADADGTAGA
ncbi:hypothetical protein GCM10023195_27870 [Actinoallomurus liliacearum]|uniref:Uncharacterized protein n=1 Tax=Actinoallomurus liliacearum TaxID=1080073 RepID=A0ABP8TJT5_9ACTN